MKQQIKRSILFSITIMSMLFTTQAQKKLVLVSQSPLTGIILPVGSKNDSRGLSILAGKLLMQSEAKKTGASINTVEILSLPPVATCGFNYDSLSAQLAASGWAITGQGSETKYVWLKKDDRNMLAYFSAEKNASNLYFAETTAAAVLAGNTTNTGVDPQNNGNIQQPLPEANNTQALQTNIQTMQTNNGTNNVAPAEQAGFAFSTTNFDDGWTSVIQNDWVFVSKGDMKVYLLYALPFDANKFTGTGLRQRDYYWDNYVTQYFNIETKQYKDDGENISSLQPDYVEGWATDKQTGERRFIAMRLGIAPNTAYITIASAKDEASLRQQFPNANGKYTSDLSAMDRYNKFAIGPNDIVGKWEKGNTSTAQWYYTTPSGYEGYAGMTVAATSSSFNFSNDGTYTSIHNGATGAVGNMSTFQQNYKGNYTVDTWKVTATNRWEGKTDIFDASFSAVKGGRILHLNNNAGLDYSLVKTQ